jgi:hypothetical protein
MEGDSKLMAANWIRPELQMTNLETFRLHAVRWSICHLLFAICHSGRASGESGGRLHYEERRLG